MSSLARATGLSLLCSVLMLVGYTPTARPQSIGYSYLHIVVKGQPVTNLVFDKKYLGWLRVDGVEVQGSASSALASKSAISSTARAPSNADRGWKPLPTILQSNSLGPGNLRFGAGDDGRMAPLLTAQEKRTFVPEAEIDLYVEETSQFVGKFKIKGIRILSLRDVQASACPMYEVTLSFQSIVKE